MAKAKGKASRIAVWVILALLVVGLIGFGTDNFGGGAQPVAFVGDQDVSAEAYARALEAELRQAQAATGEPVTMADLRAAGQEGAVLGRLLSQAALDDEAEALDLSAGDARVRDALLAEPAFQGVDGAFDPEAYRFVLERAGLTEAEFEEELREGAARQILLGAVAGGVEAPPAYGEAILDYIGETREVTYALLTEEALDAPVGQPSEEELAAWFEESAEAFTLPEMRAITYAVLRPETVIEEAAVSDKAVRALYDERVADYIRPERRLVERLVLPSEEEARSAVERLEAGDATFEDLVEGRGLDLADVDLGDVTREELGGAAEGVFGLAEPGVVGPLPTDLGPALFRVNAILAASETPFEAVEGDLRREAALAAAQREIEDRITELDDLLAGGATVEELADQGFEVGTLRLAPDATDGPAADPAFREAALAAVEGDFPEIRELAEGGLFALRLDEIVPPRVPELEEVREEAVEAWRADRISARLVERAEALREAFAEGGDVEGEGIEVLSEEALRRDGVLAGAPEGATAVAFEAEPGETAVVPGEPVALLRVDAVNPPDPEEARNALVAAAVEAQAAQGIAEDLLAAYVRSIQAERGISRNQAAINAVMAQFN